MSEVVETDLVLTPRTYKGVRGYQAEGTLTFFPAVGAVLDLLCPAPMQYIDEADLQRGTDAHALTEKALLNWKSESQTLHPEYFVSLTEDRRVRNLIEWLNQQRHRPLRVEEPLCHLTVGYAGRPDVVMSGFNNNLAVEFKFAESLDVRYFVQVEAYARISKLERLLIQITRAGEIIPHYLKPNAAHWAAFCGALSVLKWRLTHLP